MKPFLPSIYNRQNFLCSNRRTSSFWKAAKKKQEWYKLVIKRLKPLRFGSQRQVCGQPLRHHLSLPSVNHKPTCTTTFAFKGAFRWNVVFVYLNLKQIIVHDICTCRMCSLVFKTNRNYITCTKYLSFHLNCNLISKVSNLNNSLCFNVWLLTTCKSI